MPPGQRLFSAVTQWAIQVSEIESQFQVAFKRGMQSVQNSLVDGLMMSPLRFTSPRQLAIVTANSYATLLGRLRDDVFKAYEEFALSGASALPRFMDRALRGAEKRAVAEQFFPVVLEPFDEEDVEEEEDDEVLLWFGLTEEETRNIFLLLLWQGFTLQESWQRYIDVQRNQLLTRISQVLALQIGDLVDGGVGPQNDQAMRDAAAQEVRKSVAGGRSVQRRTNSGLVIGDGLVASHVQAVANAVSRKTYEKNFQFIEGVVWSAILDEHTCVRCANLDGTFYPVNARGGFDTPPNPLHARCRCGFVPALKEFVIESHNKLPRLTFVEWFKLQPEAFQKRLLGPGRFRLWKSGKLRFRDFAQFRRRVPIRERTLKELARI